MVDAQAVLRVLADLAPDRRAPRFEVETSSVAPLAWLGGYSLESLFTSGDGPTPLPAELFQLPAALRDRIDALARYDALSPTVDDLRLGWLWAVGRGLVDGEVRTIRLPLLSCPVLVRWGVLRSSSKREVHHVGPAYLWSLADGPAAADLEQHAQFGGGAVTRETTEVLLHRLPLLRRWIDDVLAASGLPPARRLAPPTEDPTTVTIDKGSIAIDVHVGYGLYAHQIVDLRRPKQTLGLWAEQPGIARTAFATAYLDSAASATVTTAAPRPVLGPLPLSEPQRDVVRRSRSAPLTVVAGPPGTGKSQTAVAVALDAVAHGRSVLIATQSEVAADVLASLLERVPGPDPVRFGGSRGRQDLARDLDHGVPAPLEDRLVQGLVATADDENRLRSAVRADLGAIEADDLWQHRLLTLTSHSLDAPDLLDPDGTASPAEAASLFHRALPGGGLFARWRAQRAERSLRSLVGAPEGTPLASLAEAIDLAMLRDRAARAGRRSAEEGERRLAAWSEAADARDRAWALHLESDVRRRVERAERRAVAALAAALRAGAATRRELLKQIDVGALTTALPLWIGTLGEIETLLPSTPGIFDLVILDEASQIEQISASAALLRAKRAVVIGDPRQLRFVSFVADRDVSAAISAHGAETLRDRLDLRRVSAFDLAASSAPVVTLDEHFRSVPHLIGFSARRFYDDRLTVATRHPATEGVRAIEVRRLSGERDDGVNRPEVEAALSAVVDLLDADDHTTIGVVSPYRAQVDAIEAAIGATIPLDRLESGRVHVGTVHQFQGGECDVIVASFAIGGKGDRGRHFLEDPHVFNVLVTRARHRLIALISGEPPERGILADYLRWAEAPPGRPPQAPVDHRWTRELAEVLGDAKVPIRVGYPTGRWTIDLVVGEGTEALAVATRPHPDGVDAHLDRHLALRRGGWRQAEAFRSTTDGDAIAAALRLRSLVRPATPAPNA